MKFNYSITNYRICFLVFLFLTMLPANAFSQNINMSVNGSANRCGNILYDSGGSGGYYLDNESITYTIYPSTAGSAVKVVFTSFSTENNWDGMMIYNGNSTGAPLISSGLGVGSNATTCPAGSWRGTGSPGTIVSTATDGSLTVVFRSDASNTSTGWSANISCCLASQPAPTITGLTYICTIGGTSILGLTWSSTDYDFCTHVTSYSGNSAQTIFKSSSSITTTENITGAQVLVVGGGGGGASRHGAGGGAGGLVYNNNFSINAGTYPVTIGAGGGGGNYEGNINYGTGRGAGGNGSNSVFSSITANGGKGGKTYENNTPVATNGSGGGGGGNTNVSGNGTPVAGGTQGNAGGNGPNNTQGNAGGGGGAGGVGVTASGNNGGAGGVGVNYSATFGASVGQSGFFAGGGGGGSRSNTTCGNTGGTAGTGGVGGNGGGGKGGDLGNHTNGTAGIANTGGGGGGNRTCNTASNFTGFDGGSGVVIIKHQAGKWSSNNTSVATVNVNTGVVTAVSNGYAVISFTTAFGKVASKIITIGAPTLDPIAIIDPTPSGTCSGNLKLIGNGIVAHYPFESHIQDISGGGLNLTATSVPDFSKGGLDISGNTLTSISTDILNNDNHTISFFIKFTTTPSGGWQKIFGYEPVGSDRSPGIWRYPADMKLHFRYDAGNAGGVESTVYTINKWYQVTGVKNGNTFNLYVDGNLVESFAVPNPKAAGNAPLKFGNSDGVILRDFKVFKRSLTANEVKNIPLWDYVFWTSGSGQCGDFTESVTAQITVPYNSDKRYFINASNGCGTKCDLVIIGSPTLVPQVASNVTVGPLVEVNNDGVPLLPDANLTTNGPLYLNHEAFRGRLFNLGHNVRGWAGLGSPNYWQVDLGSVKPVNGIVSQGRPDCCAQWTTQYEVQISQDNVLWVTMGLFTANSDDFTAVTNMFSSQTTQARYVRILPTAFNGYSTSRFDVISIPSNCSVGNQSVSMSGEPALGANTLRWYAASVGGVPLHTGQYYTVSIAASTTYYVSSYNSFTGCESVTRKAITAQVKVQVGSEPATSASLPFVGTDFSSATGTGWKTDHQGLVTPSTSTTHDCSGMSVSMSNSAHYLWIKYNAIATNAKYSLKLNNNAPTAIRNLLVEESPDGCTWTPVIVHTNVSVATDLSIVPFTINLLSTSRHLRFNMTRRDAAGGKIEVDNVIIYNTTPPPTPSNIALANSTRTCSVYGQHWVDFFNSSNEWIGSIRANGTLDGVTNNLGEVTLATFINAAGSMSACTNPTNPYYKTAYMGRSWIVTAPSIGGANFTNSVDIRLPYLETELTAMNLIASGTTTGNPNDNGAVAGTIMLTKHSGPTENSTPLDNCADGLSIGVTQTSNATLNAQYSTIPLLSGSYVQFGVGQFSEMYLNKSFNNSPLPVKMTNFTASCNDIDVQLSWTTASEQNSMDFVVERSRDMNGWQAVETLPAAGNSSENRNYLSIDSDALNGTSYYRLRQRDLNGLEEIYGPIVVTCKNENNSIKVYPNPTKGSFTVELISLTKESGVSIQLTDVTGKVIETQSIDLESGTNQIYFNNQLESGVYLIRLMDQKSSFKTLKLEVRN